MGKRRMVPTPQVGNAICKTGSAVDLELRGVPLEHALELRRMERVRIKKIKLRELLYYPDSGEIRKQKKRKKQTSARRRRVSLKYNAMLELY